MSTTTASNGVDAGEHLVSTWGYDQTNVNFYRVVRKSEKSIWLLPVGKCAVTETDYATDSEYVMPAAHPVGDVFRRSLTDDEKGLWVGIGSFEGARKWDGKPVLQTHYA